MADFVTQHCGAVGTLEIVPWTLFFDGVDTVSRHVSRMAR